MRRVAYRTSRLSAFPRRLRAGSQNGSPHRTMREWILRKAHVNGILLGFDSSVEIPEPTKKRALQYSARFYPLVALTEKRPYPGKTAPPAGKTPVPPQSKALGAEGLEKGEPWGCSPLLQKVPSPLPALTLPHIHHKKYTIGARSSRYTAKGRRVMRPTRAINVLMRASRKGRRKTAR